MDFLRYADSIGLEVKWIELGNEIFLPETDFVNRYPEPKDYGEEMVIWVDSIRQVFPDANISIIGGSSNPLTPSGGEMPERVKKWNAEVFPLLPADVDVTFHRYYWHGNSSSSPINVASTFARAFKLWEEEKSYTIDELPPNTSAWWTEYNLTDALNGNHQVATSWLHGLFTGILHLKKLEVPENLMILTHQIAGKEPFGALDSYFINGDTLTNNITPMGYAISLIHKAGINTGTATQINFTTNPIQTVDDENYPSLLAWRFEGSASDKLILLNISDQEFEVDLSPVYSMFFYNQATSSDLTALDPTSENIIFTSGVTQNTLVINP